MDAFTIHTGTAAPLRRTNVDTERPPEEWLVKAYDGAGNRSVPSNTVAATRR